MDVTALLTWLDAQIVRTEKEYALHAGNQTACQLHKDGRVTGGLKYDEGRLVAFTTLRRIVRKTSGAQSDELLRQIQAEQTRWQTALQTHQHAERPSIPWIAYNQGGVDALAETCNLLEQTA